MADLTLLDQGVAKLLEAAADLPPDDIADLIAAEQDGKTRKGAVEGLQALWDAKVAGPTEVDAQAEPIPDNIVTNTREGFVLHLGDGRKLAFGESAIVAPEDAEVLRSAVA